MTCSGFDLREYWFEELGPQERRQVEAHLLQCGNCRDELERLRLTQQALLRLKDEEVPRRIAFVSDKVFEPSWAARWWGGLAGGVPRAAFAAALVLAVFFGGAWLSRPSVTVESGRWQIAFGPTDAKLEQSIAQAVAASDARHASELLNLEQTYELLVKQNNILYRQALELRPAAFRQ
jgi:anti-sigma factor RsiW